MGHSLLSLNQTNTLTYITLIQLWHRSLIIPYYVNYIHTTNVSEFDEILIFNPTRLFLFFPRRLFLSPLTSCSSSLFCFLSLFDWEFSLFAFPVFFVFFRGQGLTFSPWVKVYGKLGFCLKAYRTAGLDICQGSVWSQDKRGCPTLFP